MSRVEKCSRLIPYFEWIYSGASYEPGPTLRPVLSAGLVSVLGARSYISRSQNTCVRSVPNLLLQKDNEQNMAVYVVVAMETLLLYGSVDWYLI